MENNIEDTTTLEFHLRTKEVEKFVNQIIYFRFGANKRKIEKFLDRIRAVEVTEHGVKLIDCHGDLADSFPRNTNVLILPKPRQQVYLNVFQVIQSHNDPSSFSIGAEWSTL